MNGQARSGADHAANSSVVEMENVTSHSTQKSFTCDIVMYMDNICPWMAAMDFPYITRDGESWELPFHALPGEIHEWSYVSNENYIILTNYRLIICLPDTLYNMPVRSIEYVEIKDLLELCVYCKDGKVYRMCFDTPEASTKWWQFLTTVTATPSKINDLFAYTCHSYSKRVQNGSSSSYQNDASLFISELKRLEFDTRSIWRISEINSKFEICPSYPKFHIVPAWTNDKDLVESSRFRSIGRFPSIVWRDILNGAVLARASQPEVGVFGWRCSEDEKLLSSIARSALLNSWTHVPLDPGKAMKPLLVIDARSYTAAFANRAKGGGFEYQEYYADCQIQFMSLTNIHGIRKSFQSLRTLCQQSQDQSNWMSSLEATKWLHYLSVLFRSVSVIVSAIQNEGQSVLVHCSDGWDRTAQLVSLAELIMDPFYRTIKGFQILMEREWLDFGHKFGDRCGHSLERDVNERSPVFLQWLDCVHQLLRQFPISFEFNEHFLVKLAMHTYSCLYGTFLCNSAKERQEMKIKHNTAQIWELFKTSKNDYRNFLYVPTQRVLYPNYQLRCLFLWENVYMPVNPKFADLLEPDDITVGQNDSAYHLREHNTACQQRNSSKDKSDINKNGHCRVESSNKSVSCNGYHDKDSEKAKGDKVLKEPNEKKDESIFRNSDCNKDNVNYCNGDSSHFDNDDDKGSLKENGLLGTKGLQGSTENHNGVDHTDLQEDNESKLGEGQNSEDAMHMSTTSSTKTITGNDELELSNADGKNVSNKTEENSNSEPTTPISGKFKGHRRTHSSDGSPIKNVMKTASYSEGMSTSAYYSQAVKSSIKSLQKPSDNIRLIGRFLSADGMLKSEDPVQQRLQEVHTEHAEEIRKLQKRFETERHARLAMASKREDIQSEPSSRRTSENRDDVGSLSDSACGEIQSISSISNEESWENVQFEDAQATRWVPDHIAIGCSECDLQFNLIVRKHHCRKCGRIFCGACADRYLPLPDEQLYDPVRVCNECYGKHCTS